ncbi:hypothetical protein D9V87_03260 [Bacteroidetes/Chlorobi group bacterium MS-B_bin-24]|jgi:hypothetical protein|nr:MAG: hypothetical protein D9V87_03260 [Bacteroidetes/Chlorobi group bacterium MS-B_bin-24]
MKHLLTLTLIQLVLVCSAFSQGILDNLQIGGNFQSDSYYYLRDSTIESAEAKEKLLSNNYLFLTLSTNNISFDLRFESYQNPILGYDPRFQGTGIAYRSISYKNDWLGITAGNFYEQFGSGMVLRGYEERNLGLDNSLDGVRISVEPFKGLNFKGLIGKQRFFWSQSKSIIRGLDANVELSSIFPNLFNSLTFVIGGSVVSRYQADLDSKYRLPENVLAFSIRVDISTSWLTFSTEFAHKYNDPTYRNKFTYNDGNGINTDISIFTSGFSLLLGFHRYDNMEFRTDREAKGLELQLNYLPSLTKQHIYSLPAFYAASTQANGEIGFKGEVNYTIPSKTLIKDEFETNIAFGFSRINSIDTQRIDDFTYKSKFFGIGPELFYRDYYIELRRKLSHQLELKLAYIDIIYNKDVMENEGSPLYGKVKSKTLATEFTYSFNKTHTLRIELQHMWSKNDSTVASDDKKNGNWFAFLAEHSIAPHWYFSLIDQWNYGNANKQYQVHYLKFLVTYIHQTTRISLGFGREAGGIVCLGGVCRFVPISYGFSLSVTTSF